MLRARRLNQLTDLLELALGKDHYEAVRHRRVVSTLSRPGSDGGILREDHDRDRVRRDLSSRKGYPPAARVLAFRGSNVSPYPENNTTRDPYLLSDTDRIIVRLNFAVRTM